MDTTHWHRKTALLALATTMDYLLGEQVLATPQKRRSNKTGSKVQKGQFASVRNGSKQSLVMLTRKGR